MVPEIRSGRSAVCVLHGGQCSESGGKRLRTYLSLIGVPPSVACLPRSLTVALPMCFSFQWYPKALPGSPFSSFSASTIESEPKCCQHNPRRFPHPIPPHPTPCRSQVVQMYNVDAPQMPTGPMHMLLDAAVGLFDVSGFSKIADRLEKEEADGGSTVRRFLPTLFAFRARRDDGQNI